MPELVIMRHAKAAPFQGSLTDFDRPLAPRGQADCATMGAWMAANGCMPDHVICSAARRTRQTTEQVLAAAGASSVVPEALDSLYAASTLAWFDALADVPADTKRALGVGHNPELERLVAAISQDALTPTSDHKVLTTANLVWLRFDGPWGQLGRNQARLIRFLRPIDLAKRID